MGAFKVILQGLIAPSDFRRDWYGYLTNQISHVGVGVLAAWLTCVMAYLIAGEYPYREHVFVLILLAYTLKEALFDKWSGFDTIEDIVFVTLYGVGGTLRSFSEIQAGSSVVSFDVFSALPVLLLCIVHLTVGTISRIGGAK